MSYFINLKGNFLIKFEWKQKYWQIKFESDQKYKKKFNKITVCSVFWRVKWRKKRNERGREKYYLSIHNLNIIHELVDKFKIHFINFMTKTVFSSNQ